MLNAVAQTFGIALLAASALGIVYTLAAAALVRRFAAAISPRASTLPAVTIIKPLYGDEPGLYENLADFAELAEVEEAHVAELSERVRPAPLVRVPFLPSDVHDLEGLAELGKYLFDEEGEPAPVSR